MTTARNLALFLAVSLPSIAWQAETAVRPPQALDPKIQKIMAEISEAGRA